MGIGGQIPPLLELPARPHHPSIQGFSELHDVKRRDVEQAMFAADQFEQFVIRHPQGCLIGDEAAVRPHRRGDALEKRFPQTPLHDGERKTGNNVVRVRCLQLLKDFGQVNGIGMHHGHSVIIKKLLLQMRGETFIQLNENNSGAGLHAPQDPARVATLTRAQLDHRAGFGKIDESRSPARKKRQTGDDVSDPYGIRQNALEEKETHDCCGK